jgi:hypothetical protein
LQKNKRAGKQTGLGQKGKKNKQTNQPTNEIPKNLSGENVEYHPRVGAKIPKIRDLQLTKSHILGMPPTLCVLNLNLMWDGAFPK